VSTLGYHGNTECIGTMAYQTGGHGLETQTGQDLYRVRVQGGPILTMLFLKRMSQEKIIIAIHNHLSGPEVHNRASWKRLTRNAHPI
jgi:hypothetical protein